MGGGITMCFANAGIPVTVLEMNQEAIDRGLGIIRRNYDGMVQRGRISAEAAEKRMALISTTLAYEDLGQADVVVEAVYENLDVKKKVFEEFEKVCKPGAIIASNTSGLDVDAMASVTSRP
ncbi:MAG: 3-hydroxyacyl-CoA dehydrogenase, partial [Actinobacteria bacterium]|nr:3-hydroxyacyl-CoA dehydrogenase [Actinomycetota bacterium]